MNLQWAWARVPHRNVHKHMYTTHACIYTWAATQISTNSAFISTTSTDGLILLPFLADQDKVPLVGNVYTDLHIYTVWISPITGLWLSVCPIAGPCLLHTHTNRSFSHAPDPRLSRVAGLDPLIPPVGHTQSLWSLLDPFQTYGHFSTCVPSLWSYSVFSLAWCSAVITEQHKRALWSL